MTEENTGEQSQPRVRSSIRFPYNDLNDAMALATTLHERRGGRCLVDELAAELDRSAISGRFRLRVAGTQLYGLVRLNRGQLSLTELGSQIIDPRTEADARVRAFLNVPLYEQLYQDSRRTPLPGPKGLEAKMRGLGVVTNQATRARQVFMRAAEQAGFFNTGRDRLVKPANSGMMEDDAAGSPPEQPPAKPDEGGSTLSDPLLDRLLTRMLPPEGQPFPARERRLFFTALAVNLNVIYGEPEDGSLDPAKVAELIKVDTAPRAPAKSTPDAMANGAGQISSAAPTENIPH